jgi:Leucine-rich repeat (LRR) protein
LKVLVGTELPTNYLGPIVVQDESVTSQLPTITAVDEYEGQEAIAVRATQLGTDYSASRARRIVADWVRFLSAGPSPIRTLRFTTRTPSRLFEALAGQPQLQSLEIKWGDYADLSPLGGMPGLESLTLRGASKVSSVEPLAVITSLRSLAIEGFQEIANPSPLGRLTALTELELGGNWIAPRNGHLPSIAFLRELPGLAEVLLHTVIVDDKDYSPLMDLPHLRKVRVMAVQGMDPSIEDLKAALPWSA